MTTTHVLGTGDRAEPWIPDSSSFGARLALVRHAHGWNVKEAALACGIAVQSWRNWEEGRRPQDLLDACRKISSATGVSYDWLLDGRELVSRTGTGYDTSRYAATARGGDGGCVAPDALAPVVPIGPWVTLDLGDSVTESDRTLVQSAAG